MKTKKCLSIGLVASLILLGEATGALADYSSVILDDNPIHYWRLEESITSQPAADTGTTPTNAGVYTGGVTLGQPTAPTLLGGTCALFDGANGTFVDLGLFHPGDSASFEAWVNMATDANTTFKAIVARWDGSYEMDANGGTGDVGNLVVRDTNNTFIAVATASAFVRGQWHHVVGTYDSAQSTTKIYLDAAPGTTNVGNGVSPLQNLGLNTPDRVFIAATRSGIFNWRGLIAKVAVYNYALTPTQILTHYNAGIPTNAPALSIQPAVIVQWPAFPAGYVLQVTDSLSNPNWATYADTPTLASGSSAEVIVTAGATHKFYRTVNSNVFHP